MDTPAHSGEPGRGPAFAPALLSAPGQEVNRATCREALATGGLLREPWLAQAFDNVDREAFVPSAVWLPVRDAEGLWQFVDRDEDPRAWRRAVWDPYRSVVTQLDDGAQPPAPPRAISPLPCRLSTSSCASSATSN